MLTTTKMLQHHKYILDIDLVVCKLHHHRIENQARDVHHPDKQHVCLYKKLNVKTRENSTTRKQIVPVQRSGRSQGEVGGRQASVEAGLN
jgi:hypothetical protein